MFQTNFFTASAGRVQHISVSDICGLGCAYISVLVQSSCGFQANPLIVPMVVLIAEEFS